MPSLRIRAVFIFFSAAILRLTLSVPISDQTYFRTHNTHPQSNFPTPNALSKVAVNGVPNDFFSRPKPNDTSPVETSRTNKFGLWATGSTVPEKTILLNDGAAKNEATFTLILREGEEVKGMSHRPDDSSIITSFEEARERYATSPASYNITITHHFRGTVGVAQYELTILTTKGAALRVTGVYYVAGIVLYASIDSKPPSIVSGVTSPPLTVNSISSFSSFTGMSSRHRIMFPLKFQNVGPDVSPTPPSIFDQLSKAVVSVTNTNASGQPILSNSTSCPIRTKEFHLTTNKNNREEKCDARLDLDSLSLELNLNPEGYGRAVIDISLPRTSTNIGRMKTEVRLNVLKPAIIKPELDLSRNLGLRLDHFGGESFFLTIKNGNPDGNPQRKVLSYVVDLPGDRYAISEFNSSSLEGPTQFISFTVIPRGLEDKKIQNAIRLALKLLPGARRRPRPGQISYVDVRQLDHDENVSAQFQSNFLVPITPSLHEQASSNVRVMPADLVPEVNHSYQSHVHALFPRFDTLVTVDNPSRFKIWTSFSSDGLAKVELLQVLRGRQNMLFKVTLLHYTSTTFSQHKSKQIARSLSKEVASICKTAVEQANLVKIDDEGLNLKATYHLVIAMKFTDSDIKLDKYKKNLSRSVSSDILLKNGQFEVKEIVRLVKLWRPAGQESTTTEKANRFKGIKGVLIGIFVGLCIAILIPLLILCIGSLLPSRRRTNDSSSLGNDRKTEEPKNDIDGSEPLDLLQPASDVLKDNYGRAEEDESSYRTFKVSSEMARQGYYGDEAPSGTRKAITFADT